ncbi:replication restart DNA helicase PriA [Brevinema andersonii]|uniref:Replication restart protein PriA n=1 Tax=Brevinema andersonii TaxID=34097 RepID=A0A1I1ERQ8_BREAD|nr:primosomal protein N' [Brevinema andersonii]SFB89814.1 replication restart DNA helicase PriA [Brevinema andersonii]
MKWKLAEVAINVPLYDTFLYIIPDHLLHEDLLLKRVYVSFGRREEIGLVINMTDSEQVKDRLGNFTLKYIDNIIDETPVFTHELLSLGQTVATYYYTPIGEVLFTMLPPLKNPKPFVNPHIGSTRSFTPTNEQIQAFKKISPHIGTPNTFLLQGITGSGKTEVYKLLVKKALEENKSCIILVPEIALTDQTLKRFTEEFNENIALFHSRLSPEERVSEWLRTLQGHTCIVIGPRSAIFAPVKNLGLIIVDEEHDPSYKAGDSPRYHARGVAFMRSKRENALLVLGSATPSIESRYAVQSGIIQHVQLNKRFNNTELPHVEIVDLKKEKSGNYFLSELLFSKLIETLNNKKQSLIFLNRRGYAPSLLCQDCGFFFKCPNCDIGLTWHKHDSSVKCRYCGFEDTAPSLCTECNGLNIKDIGHGTEKLEDTLQALLPQARILRLDLDIARKKNKMEKILHAMQNHEADILVGTQMIAKGHDIANINLVGALFPEIMLSIPDFRASERTFSLLAQAVGRSGRRWEQGLAIIQSFLADHFSIQTAALQDYETFYKEELKIRQTFEYPPFKRIGRIVFRSIHQQELQNFISQLKKNLIKQETKNITQLGPCPCPIEKINNQYRYHIIIKADKHLLILQKIQNIHKIFKSSPEKDKIKIEIDIDPTQII